jgi:uncharacterized repeat protein (TIGR01451 family)
MCAFKSSLKRLLATGLVAFFGVVYSTSALAIGTAANTDIDNSATVDYQVSGASQLPITSNETSFKVDQVVDLSVAEADGAETAVVPNQQDAVARFTVTNTGNAAQDFSLSVNNVASNPFGVPDDFDPTAFTIVVDVNNNNVYDPLVDTATFIDELGPDVTGDEATDNVISVFVLADIPLGPTPGQGANIQLVAEALEGGASGAQGDVQVASGGPNTDGLEVAISNATASADDAYLVGAVAALAATKASQVVSDPLVGVSPNALAIPGAIVEYTITITNSGSVAATDVTVSDTLPGDLTFVNGGYDVGVTNSDVQIDANGATSYCIAEAGGTDTNGDGCVLTGAVLTVGAAGMTADTLDNAPNNIVTVRFQVSIN